MDMRRIIVITMITLDESMQAPGGPEEDMLLHSKLAAGLHRMATTFLTRPWKKS